MAAPITLGIAPVRKYLPVQQGSGEKARLAVRGFYYSDSPLTL